MSEKILVAMSGGVDSSAAAALLTDAGHTCIGATMRLLHAERQGACCSLSDAEDARAVAACLGMRYYVFDFSEQFEECVIKRFVRAYEQGQTPNPCIDCNRYLKFARLYERAEQLGCDAVATGHYARVEYDGASGRWLLKRGRCAEKDQSYVLAFLSQEQLSRTRFPLGAFADKAAVRAYAAKHGFFNADKPDSEDICFVPDGDYAAFLQEYTGKVFPPGDFVDEQGRVLGRHAGIVRYTVGQRKGLGVALGRRMYVKRILPETGQVVLSEDPSAGASRLIARDFNWIACPPPTGGMRAQAVVRYQGKVYGAQVRALSDAGAEISFDTPARAACPGQAVVLYDGDTVIGGGRIAQVFD